MYHFRLVSPSPPPRSTSTKRPSGAKKAESSMIAQVPQPQIVQNVISAQQVQTFKFSESNGKLTQSQALTQDDEDDREEEEVDPEELKRKNEAIRKWLIEQPDPSEYVGNEILRTRRQKDGKAKKAEQLLGDAEASNQAQESQLSQNDQPVIQSAETPRRIREEPFCVAFSKKSLLARTIFNNDGTWTSDVPLAMDINAIPLIAQAQTDTVQFILEKRERSASLSAGTEGEEILEAQKSKNYNRSALFCLDLQNPVRRAAIAVVEWIWLEIVMLITIFVNCIFMSLYDPCYTSSRDSNIDKTTSYIFIFIYFFEFLIKITAMGFITGQYSYLKDNWNKLDFLIVVTGILDALPFDTLSTSFTAFRLLRPLRAIRLLRSIVNTTGYLKDLDLLVKIIVSSSSMLLHVAMLIGLLMLVFGIIGVVFFAGSGRGRCYDVNNGTIYEIEMLCSSSLAASCPLNFGCLALGDNAGIFHFDDVGHAMLVVLQTMTMRGWSETLENTEDGSSAWANMYFLALLALGPLFLAKLFLVILSDQYTCIEQESKQSEHETLCLFEIRVGIIEARHLPRMDTFGEADPYVEVRLGNTCKVTKVIKNTLSPEWHDYFTFSVTSLGARLALTMFDWNRFGSHEFIGKVSIPVGQLDDTDEGTNLWYELEEQDSGSSNGAIHVILQWRRSAADPWPNHAKPLDLGGTSGADLKALPVSRQIADSKYMHFFITAITTINVLGLTTEYNCEINSDESCRNSRFGLDLMYIFCTFVFLLENVINLVAYGVVNYFKDTLHLFNTLIVLLGVLEIPILVTFSWKCVGPIQIVPACQASYPQSPLVLVKVLRIIRVLRFAKLMIDISPYLKRKFETVKTSAIAASTAMPVIILMVLMAAILGMNLFGGFSVLNPQLDDDSRKSKLEVGAWARCILPDNTAVSTCRILNINASRAAPFLLQSYPANGVEYWAVTRFSEDAPSQASLETFGVPTITGLVPRGNFDSFLAATLTSLQLITLSDFDNVWSTSVLGSGSSIFSSYFVAMILIGHFLVFNLFVAITIQSLAAQNDWQSVEVGYIPVEDEEDPMKTRYEQGQVMLLERGDSRKMFGKSSVVPEISSSELPSPIQENEKEVHMLKARNIRATGKPSISFSRIVESWIFKQGMLAFLTASIGTSFVLQAPREFQANASDVSVIVLTLNAFLILEIVFKIRCFGYLKFIQSFSNCLDSSLLLVSLLYATSQLDSNENAFSTVTGYLNSFQPLRLVFRSNRLLSGIKSIVMAFLPAIGFAAVLFIPILIFSLLGVQVLAGKLHFCSDPLIFYKKDCIGFDPYHSEIREWLNSPLNFDWIGNSLLSIFSIVSLNDWTHVLWLAVDASGPDTGPFENSNSDAYMVMISSLTVILVFIAGVFGLHIFIGVFVDTYKKRLFVQSAAECVRKASKGKKVLQTSMKSFASNDQSEMIDLYEPDQQKSKYRNAVFHVIVDSRFEFVVLAVIFLNIVFMPFETYKESEFQKRFQDNVNFIFCATFAFEASAKLYALYPLQYFESRWNQFDFMVVVVCFVDLLLDFQGMAFHSENSFFRVFRVVRVLRILRIFKFSSVFQRIMEVISRSFANVLELLFIFGLTVIVVGWLCVELYGNMCQVDVSGEQIALLEQNRLVDSCLLVREEDLLPQHKSFQNIGIAILTLIKLATRDKWEIFTENLGLSMNQRPSGLNATNVAKFFLTQYVRTHQREFLDLARAELPGCQSAEELLQLQLEGLVICENSKGLCKSNCGSAVVTPILFPTYLCVASFVLLSLVLAVLMQHLQEMNMDVQKLDNLANKSSKYKKNLRALMNVNEATVFLRKKIQS